MEALRAVGLFGAAAIAEIGGAFLIWQAVREGGAWWLALLGALALIAYGFVATFQSDPHFGRILVAYGGVFVAGSLLWGVLSSTASGRTAGTSPAPRFVSSELP
jgi:small multidrug resistance family-3 protein